MFPWFSTFIRGKSPVNGKGHQGCFTKAGIEVKGPLFNVGSALQELEVGCIGVRTGVRISGGGDKSQGQKKPAGKTTGIPHIGSTDNQRL